MIINYLWDSLSEKGNPKNIFSKDIPDFVSINIFDIAYPKDMKKAKHWFAQYATRNVPFLEVTTNKKKILEVIYQESGIDINSNLINSLIEKHRIF